MRSFTRCDFLRLNLPSVPDRSRHSARIFVGRCRRSALAALLAWGALVLPAAARQPSTVGVGPAVSAVATADSRSDDEQIAQLIRDLGAEDYFQRQRAQQLLATFGSKAFDALVAAQTHEDIEIASRAKFLLHKIDLSWEHEGDDPDVHRILKGYGEADEETRMGRAANLALLPCDISAGPLARIARYEPSEAISRRAALLLIQQKAFSEISARKRREEIVDKLGSSQRVAADWLRTFVKAADDPRAAVVEWTRYTDQFRKVFVAGQDRVVERQLMLGLLQYQAELWNQLGQSEQAQPLYLQVVEWSATSPDSMLALVRWLVEQKAFSAIDALEPRHKKFIDTEPLVLYALAEARDQQGEAELSEKAAAKASLLSEQDTLQHLRVAYFLRQQGLMKWAEQEFNTVTKLVPATHSNALSARFLLAETLHDRGRHFDAAKLFEEAVAAMQKNEAEGNADQNNRREISSARSRMHYFYARHFEEMNDRAKQKEHLEQAIAIDATDADALISLYRLPNPSEEDRARVSLLLRTAGIAYRKQIEQESDNATAYNQLAWLVGSTEGDYHEAVKHSLKSLELQAGTAAYLDTLGRCYYAAGDLDNAIKHQIMAVQREPYSEQMQRQLKTFLAEQAMR